MTALFMKIGEQEMQIRQNPGDSGGKLLKTLFN
jgi:hypothetical protein